MITKTTPSEKVMAAITTSKLFMCSENQPKILSAIQSPINKELVQQLNEYLDDEYKAAQDTQDTQDTEVEEVEDDSTAVDEGTESESEGTANEGGDDQSDDTDDNNEGASSEDNGDSESDDTSSESGELVEESSNLSGDAVMAQTVLNPEVSEHSDTFNMTEAVRGTLNIRQDTCGVIRVKATHDELWVYYNDKINLNNIMAPVIEVLCNAGFYTLEFNRLARTDNAIVFQILEQVTSTTERGTDGEE